MTNTQVPDTTLAGMMAYYRACADEYDEWFYRRGRYDRDTITWFGRYTGNPAEYANDLCIPRS